MQARADSSYNLEQLRTILENFLEEERAKTVMNRLLTSVDFTFEKRNGHETFEERKAMISRQCFSPNECDTISTLIVKKLDPTFQLHCDQPNCGTNCKFFRLQCPNDGCPVTMSRIYLSGHDKQCIYKIIECKCGDRFPRHELDVHSKQVCKLRQVDCPFKKIGCTKVVRACDIQTHLVDAVNTHLLLALNRMMEHQNVISDLNTRLIAIEDENKKLKLALENHVKESTSDSSTLEKKFKNISKALAAHQASCKKEFRKLSR